MKKQHSVKDLSNALWDIEEKYDLNNWKANDCYIWLYLRIAIYYRVAAKLKIFEPQESEKSPFGLNKIGSIFKEAISAILTNIKIRFKKYDSVVFEHDRKSKLPSGLIGDIYSYQFRKEQVNGGKKVLSIRETTLGKTDDLNDVWNLFWVKVKTAVLEKLTLKFRIQSFTEEEALFIKKLEDEIEKKLSVKVDLLEFMLKYSVRYKIRHRLFNNVLKILNLEEVKIVAPYDRKFDFVEAAKSLGHTVDELQHGIISKYHFGYSYQNPSIYEGMVPDNLLLWSKYWDLGANFPKRVLQPQITGQYPFEFLTKEARATNINKTQLTLISQGALTNQFADFILSNQEQLKRFNIKYKLHPFEFGKIDNFKLLSEVSKLENVEVIERCDLLKLMASSEFVVGAFSTALIEAKEINPNLKVVILDLPGSEYFENSKGYLMQDEFMQLVSCE